LGSESADGLEREGATPSMLGFVTAKYSLAHIHVVEVYARGARGRSGTTHRERAARGVEFHVLTRRGRRSGRRDRG